MEIKESKGRIVSIRDVVVEIEFLDDPKPFIHEVLKLEKNHNIVFRLSTPPE